MADEAQVRTSLHIIQTVGGVRVQDARPQPTAFSADVALVEGPTPGSFLASTAGTDVDLSKLTTPGLARFMHNGAADYVQYGIWDPAGVRFYPLGEILPGESYVIRLSRDIQQETGTGDPGTAVQDTDNRLRFKAIGAAVQVKLPDVDRQRINLRALDEFARPLKIGQEPGVRRRYRFSSYAGQRRKLALDGNLLSMGFVRNFTYPHYLLVEVELPVTEHDQLKSEVNCLENPVQVR